MGRQERKKTFHIPPQYAQPPCGAAITAHVSLRQSRNEAHLPDLRLPVALIFLSGELCAPMSPRRGHSRSHREGDREHCSSPVAGADEMAGGGMLGRASRRAPPIPPHPPSAGCRPEAPGPPLPGWGLTCSPRRGLPLRGRDIRAKKRQQEVCPKVIN